MPFGMPSVVNCIRMTETMNSTNTPTITTRRDVSFLRSSCRAMMFSSRPTG